MRKNFFFRLSNFLALQLLEGDNLAADRLFPALLVEPGRGEMAYEALYWPLLAFRPEAQSFLSASSFVARPSEFTVTRLEKAESIRFRMNQGSLLVKEAGESYLFHGAERPLPLPGERLVHLDFIIIRNRDLVDIDDAFLPVVDLAHRTSSHLPNVELFEGRFFLSEGVPPVELRLAVEDTSDERLRLLRECDRLAIQLLGKPIEGREFLRLRAAFVFSKGESRPLSGDELALLPIEDDERPRFSPEGPLRIHSWEGGHLYPRPVYVPGPAGKGSPHSPDGFLLEAEAVYEGESDGGAFLIEIPRLLLPRKEPLPAIIEARHPSLRRNKDGSLSLLFLLQGAKERSSFRLRLLDPGRLLPDDGYPLVEVKRLENEEKAIGLTVRICRENPARLFDTVYETSLREGRDCRYRALPSPSLPSFFGIPVRSGPGVEDDDESLTSFLDDDDDDE